MKLRTYIRYRLFQGLKIAALLLFLVSCGPGSGRYAQLLEEAEWMNRNYNPQNEMFAKNKTKRFVP